MLARVATRRERPPAEGRPERNCSPRTVTRGKTAQSGTRGRRKSLGIPASRMRNGRSGVSCSNRVFEETWKIERFFSTGRDECNCH